MKSPPKILTQSRNRFTFISSFHNPTLKTSSPSRSTPNTHLSTSKSHIERIRAKIDNSNIEANDYIRDAKESTSKIKLDIEDLKIIYVIEKLK